MPRGGARPGAGRPTNAAIEERKTLGQRTMAKCQERLQRALPELVDAYLKLALEGDKDAIRWCLERGLGKAAVATHAVADTEIKVVLGAIPRPGRVNGAQVADGADTGDGEGSAAGEGGIREAVLEMDEGEDQAVEDLEEAVG